MLYFLTSRKTGVRSCCIVDRGSVFYLTKKLSIISIPGLQIKCIRKI